MHVLVLFFLSSPSSHYRDMAATHTMLLLLFSYTVYTAHVLSQEGVPSPVSKIRNRNRHGGFVLVVRLGRGSGFVFVRRFYLGRASIRSVRGSMWLRYTTGSRGFSAFAWSGVVSPSGVCSASGPRPVADIIFKKERNLKEN